MKFTQTSFAVAAMAAAANAHMNMLTPEPFGLKSGALNNSPLEESGADFPCKVKGGAYPPGNPTKWNAGESQQVTFKGSAVHGGGSCQFSITKDKAPTKQSDWRVIHSVVGGCPADAAGNIGNDPNGSGASKFQVTMPKDIASGDYTFAWTWFNKIGNREMYMNCAPITVSGGSGDGLKSLPNMVVANLGGKCLNPENGDLDFENPGKSVQKGPNAKPQKLKDTAGCSALAAWAGGSNAGSGNGSPSGGDTKPAPSSPAGGDTKPSSPAGGDTKPSPSKPAAAPSKTAQVFAPGAPEQTTTPQTPSNPAPPAGGNQTGGTPCSTNGEIVCIGSNQFGICSNGVAVAQPLAAGMKCAGGKISKRAAHPHFHRRHGSKMI